MVNISYIFFISIFLLGFVCLEAKKHVPDNFEPRVSAVRKHHAATWEEEWAYVTVRPKAHLFYWLQYTTHKDGYKNRPLVFWHQGGPGVSSTGYGNMEIIGPVNIHGTYRNDTWLQSVSIVYLDSPVGTGYSYVEEWSALTTDIDEIADDLLTLAKVFYKDHPDFQAAPAYVFGESYGGKVAVVFAQVLNEAFAKGEVTCNLKGYALGNTWVAPMDSLNAWGPFLHEMSCLDKVGLAAVNSAAAKAQKACDDGRWKDATVEWSNTQYAVINYTNYVDFYNVLNYVIYDSDGATYMRNRKKVHSTRRCPRLGLVYDVVFAPFQSDNLHDYMNKEAREMIGIIPDNVTWSVDDTLNNTNLHVVVYQGQLDLICGTKGALNWVQRLKWKGLKEYNKAKRFPLTEPLDGQTDTYVKAYNNFKFYWMLRAGHAVPQLMGPSALRMLERILTDQDR